MGTILSQAEIDELLNALSTGEDPDLASEDGADSVNVRIYDFRSANRFPKEQIRTLNIVFQTYAQIVSNSLASILRTACEFEMLSVEEISFNEFNNSLPSPVVLAIYKSPPMSGSHLIQVSPEAAYMIVARLLGGLSAGIGSSKQFTEIELALLERVVKQLIRPFEEAWDKVLRVSPQLERIETSPQFAQIVALNEPIALVTMNLTIGDESGLVSICIPHSSIEPVNKQLTTRLWYSSAQEASHSEIMTEAIGDRLVNTEIPLTAYFDETTATVQDIVNLQVGDVIRLSHKVSDPLLLKLQHIPKFRAKVGTSGSRYAVQIVDIIKEEDEDESIPRRN